MSFMRGTGVLATRSVARLGIPSSPAASSSDSIHFQRQCNLVAVACSLVMVYCMISTAALESGQTLGSTAGWCKRCDLTSNAPTPNSQQYRVTGALSFG